MQLRPWLGCVVVVAALGGAIAACGSEGDPSIFNPTDGDASVDVTQVDPGKFDPNEGGTQTGRCRPLTCQAQGAECGKAGDGCGGIIDCGSCNAPATCGGGGQPSKCGGTFGCVPKTCQQQGVSCGPAGDGCGGVLQNCGTCTSPQICGGGGTPSACGGGPTSPDGGACVPLTCATAGNKNCGWVANGCGGIIFCGAGGPDAGTGCTSPQICGGGGVANVCGGGTSADGGPICTPRTCAQANANCGYVADGCGAVIFCGTGSADAGAGCPPGQFCGGGGPNRCGAAGSDAGTCTGLCLNQVQCDGGGTTTLSGRVWGPQGATNGSNGRTALPIPGALVYVPNGALAAMPQGVTGGQCDQCNAQASGSPLVSTTTAPDGTFTLTNVPVVGGNTLPVVVQLGRWRRMVTLTQSINACTTNTVADGVLRLPATQAEGNIPLFAISTGHVDGLECVLRKMGVADSEFTNPSGTGRIRFYQDDSPQGSSSCSATNFAPRGARISNATPGASTLLSAQANLDAYDAVIFGCPGHEFAKTTAQQQRVVSYADRGGRVFATHYGYVWLYGQEDPNDTNYITPWAATGPWNVEHHGYDNATRFLLNVSFTKGQNFTQWLNTTTVAALANGTTSATGLPYPGAPEISIVQSRHDLNRTVTSPAQEWAYSTANTPTNGPGEAMTLHYTFNTPWNIAPANQCGRVVYSDFHVSTGATCDLNFPAECSGNTLTSQEKVLAFMLLDLTSCITPDTGPPPTCTPLTCAQQSIQCGQAGNGCGGVINCGPCPPGQTCGGGGTPFVCGGPACTPRTCQQQGVTCGPAGDGCGGTLNCGACPTPDASCAPRSCTQQNAQCGPLADGCGNLLDCGPCPPGQVCQGNRCLSNPCVPRTCQQAGANCGPIGDGCGNVIDCGPCPPGQTCGGGGTPNVCGGDIPR